MLEIIYWNCASNSSQHEESSLRFVSGCCFHHIFFLSGICHRKRKIMAQSLYTPMKVLVRRSNTIRNHVSGNCNFPKSKIQHLVRKQAELFQNLTSIAWILVYKWAQQRMPYTKGYLRLNNYCGVQSVCGCSEKLFMLLSPSWWKASNSEKICPLSWHFLLCTSLLLFSVTH